jgi:hypothetical protein
MLIYLKCNRDCNDCKDKELCSKQASILGIAVGVVVSVIVTITIVRCIL